jgi:hypothetical protein
VILLKQSVRLFWKTGLQEDKNRHHEFSGSVQGLLSGRLEEQEGGQVQSQRRVTALVQLTKEGHAVSQKALPKNQQKLIF